MPLRLSPTWISQIEAVVLTGLSTATNALVTATDSILSAFGKLQAQSTYNAQALGAIGRNKLLNGRFNIQQRGTGPWTASGAYTADRWLTLVITDTLSVTIVALADADRAAIGDEYATSAMQLVVAGTYSGFTQFGTHMESVRVLSGKTVTLSFYAKASATLSIGAYFYQSFGSGGSPSGGIYVAPATFSLSTTWARFSATYTMPSIAGKTFGSNNDDNTELYFGLSAEPSAAAVTGVGVQSGTFTIWGVQVEIGGVASSLESRGIDVELAMCQRFYINQTVFTAGYAAAAGTAYGQFVFPVQMRGVPSVTFSAQAYTNASALATVSVRATDLISSITVTATGAARATATLALSADI